MNRLQLVFRLLGLCFSKSVLATICFLLAFDSSLTTFASNEASSVKRVDIRAVWPRKAPVMLPGLVANDVVYVSLKALADFFGGRYTADPVSGKATITFRETTLNFTQFSPYVVNQQNSYNLNYDIIFSRQQFFAPAAGMANVISRLIPEDVVFSPSALSLTVSPSRHNVLDYTVQRKLNGLLLEITLTKKLRYDVAKTTDSWMIVTIYDGLIDTSYFNGRRPSPIILDTKAYQFENSAQLSIRFRLPEFNFVHRFREDPPRIQISVKGPALASGDVETLFSDTLPPRAVDTTIDVVVIDPGHGGDDLGAVGKSGLIEKDVVLDIARRLRQLLEGYGLRVVLTREDDRIVPLADRTKIANEANADLFISLHCNAATNPQARGSIVFFLADANTDQARAAMALENSSLKFDIPGGPSGSDSVIALILSDMTQSAYLQESSQLAQILYENLSRHKEPPTKGVDQGGFFVLNRAFMPSVLIEIGFLTNQKDEEWLSKEKNRQQVAQAIADSILEFKRNYEAKR